MKIINVGSAAELKKFIRLTYHLYQNDNIWVPPLHADVYKQFDKRRNPTLDHCEYALFLLERENKIIGRIGAFFDKLALEI